MKNIAELLVRENIVRVNFENPFIWTSGIKSPIYCDCRELIGIVEARNQIIEAFCEQIKTHEMKIEVLAGTATAGIPWAAFLAEKLELPMIYVRKSSKGHGAGKLIEGRVESGKNVLLVEDAFSTGGSSIRAAEGLKTEINAQMNYILGIFSWSTSLAQQAQKDAGIEFVPLTVFEEITEALVKQGTIDAEKKNNLKNFHRDPAGWGDRQSLG